MKSQTDLPSKFDPLIATANDIAAPALAVTVTNNETAQEALLIVKQVKAVKELIENRRKALTGPLNAEVKAINDYAKTLTADLVKGEAHVKEQLVAHERRLEAERRDALRALETERLAREKAALEERQALEAEALFGVKSDGEVSEALDQIELAHRDDREIDKLSAQNIAENKVSGTRKVWSFQIKDESQIPRAYLMVDPRTIRDAIRDGVRSIPGVEIFQETKIAIKGGF